MKKYYDSKVIINRRISMYFDDFISKFISINITLEMNEIMSKLFDYTYLQICGAFEKKISVCRYYLMSINYDYAYDKAKLANETIYKHNKLGEFFKEIEQYFSIGFKSTVDNFLYEYVYNKDNQKLCKRVLENLKQQIDYKNYEHSALINFCRLKFDDFKDNWENISNCESELKNYMKDGKCTKYSFFNELYNSIWDYRHIVAHNLNSLYSNNPFQSIYITNIFFRIALLFCIDEVIIDIMNSIIKESTG